MLSILNKITVKHLALLLLICLVFLSVHVKAAQTAPPNTNPGSTINQRIAQRKKEQKVRLDTTNTERIQSVCVDAQNKLRTERDSYTTSSNSRDNIYRGIDAKLWVTIGSLKLIDKDTFKLEQQRLELAKMVKNFDNSSSQFRQTIDDLTAINCKADPNGFMALLQTARLYNAQIRDSFTSIKSYIIDQIEPTISNYADDLKIKTSTN